MRKPTNLFLFLFGAGCLAQTTLAATPALSALRDCGTLDREPRFNENYGTAPRPCPQPIARHYQPRYGGEAQEALTIESEACYVPDSSYQALDAIIDAVKARAAAEGLGKATPKRELMLRLSAITGDVLIEQGYTLYVPTHMLGDALYHRGAAGGRPIHMIDCDNSSLILLSVAKAFGLEASLVDMTTRLGNGHNYVRWHIDDQNSFDWDTNGRQECRTPSGLPSYEGHSLTEVQVKSYLVSLRAQVWKRRSEYDKALLDFRQSIDLHPDTPDAYNSMAWMIATREFPGRQAAKTAALDAALRAVALERSANNLDTLACAYAVNGKFTEAIEVQTEAIRSPNGDMPLFKARLEGFSKHLPRDCTGAK